MPLDIHITGGVEGEAVNVTPEGNLTVAVDPAPAYGVAQKQRPFRQYLTADGTSTGSTDMAVDGSSTNVEFWVPANLTEDKDRYITTLSWVIADAGAAANEFANVAALTNGCQLEYVDENGPVTIHEALQTNFDFVRLCAGTPAFGDTTNAMRMSNVSGASEAFIPVLDLTKIFGFPYGFRLAAGSRQKIVMRIRDDCTAPDQFDCIAYGNERAK